MPGNTLEVHESFVLPSVLISLYPNFLTRNRLRWMAYKRHQNGLAACGAVVMIGGKSYWNAEKFHEWLTTTDRGE